MKSIFLFVTQRGSVFISYMCLWVASDQSAHQKQQLMYSGSVKCMLFISSVVFGVRFGPTPLTDTCKIWNHFLFPWRKEKSISQNLVFRFDVFVAGDCSADVLFLRAMCRETRRWVPLHTDTDTASGAEDDYVSVWVPIFFFNNDMIESILFLKVSYFETSQLVWLQPSCHVLCWWKSITLILEILRLLDELIWSVE